ncbi:MAG: sigma-70 family RNA polymerase sigma factor [Alphaproteobacteria bacterium]|nr:MAG: sigma-70 family RNA polymerase sigma factor [Alphaproteobacteria bacterium]
MPVAPNNNNAADNAQLTTWLQAAAEGDQSAFRHLAQTLGPRMYGLAARLCDGNSAVAQDVVQEVLIKLWQQAPRWQSGGSVAAFASRLVYTTAMDHHRRKGSTISLSADDAPEIPEPETVTGHIEQTQTRRQLLGALSQLPERQQQAVALAYFHEYRAQDIATALGTTEKAVESLLVRARKSLATLLPASLNPSS